jgi:hypothetical protein
MSVDRFGTAYVLYNDGNLYRVKVADASCEGTDFEPGQLDSSPSMGFARDPTKTDQLFVATFLQPAWRPAAAVEGARHDRH